MCPKHFLSAFLVFAQLSLSAQSSIEPLLEIGQNYIEVSAGDSINFSIKNNSINGIVSMKNAPEKAFLSDQLEFDWIVPSEFSGQRIMIDFSLEDSTGLLDHKSMMIMIKKTVDLPVIKIQSEYGEKTIYNLQIGTSLELIATGLSSSSENPEDVQLDYYFNDQSSLKQIDGAEVEVVKNVATIVWNPTHALLIEKYFSLTLVVMDKEFHVTKKTLLFVVNKKNQSPYFIYPVLDEYYISAHENLTVNVTAGDPDGDSLIYHLDIPTKIGNPKLSERGKFSWRLNDDQIMRLRKSFPIEVTVEVTEIGVDNPNTIVKRFVVQKSVRNQPPKILNLQNERISEGLSYRKTVFIQDGNDDYTELEIDIRGAPKGMEWTFIDNMLVIDWTPDFNVVGVEMKPEKFDMLLVVSDPYGYVDQKAFTLTVVHREDTDLTYRTYMDYRDDAVYMVETLSQIHQEMIKRENKIENTKKSLSVLTMIFAAYTASGTYYEEGSFAHTMVPFVGSLAVIAGGINAFGFNDLPQYSSIRENSFVLQQKLMYVLAILSEYRIEGPNSPNLESAEFREDLKTFEQWAAKDKLDFKHYYSNFLSLNYIKRRKKKEIKEANELNREPSGMLFLEMNTF
ncbi:MAG: hypothetical protein JXR07_01520 [Reichenbachiella sp.]